MERAHLADIFQMMQDALSHTVVLGEFLGLLEATIDSSLPERALDPALSSNGQPA